MAGTRRYNLVFADGKKATALDMTNEEPGELMRRITNSFHAGYVQSIEPAKPKKEQQHD